MQHFISKTSLWLAGISLCTLIAISCSKGGDTDNNNNNPPPASCTQGTAGPKYTAVKALINTNCAISGCHAGAQAPDFRNDCNIINNASLIKARAVDGIPSIMPPTGPLPSSEKNKITEWVSAGGKFTD